MSAAISQTIPQLPDPEYDGYEPVKWPAYSERQMIEAILSERARAAAICRQYAATYGKPKESGGDAWAHAMHVAPTECAELIEGAGSPVAA